jgi:hypothetical protein
MPDVRHITERVAAIRRAVKLLADGDAGTRAVAVALDLWVSSAPGDAVPFHIALGLPPCWRSDHRRAVRDAALIEIASRHFPNIAGRKAARAITGALRKYESISWPRDRMEHRRPDGLRGLFFDALSAGEVPGEESLRRLLTG